MREPYRYNITIVHTTDMHQMQNKMGDLEVQKMTMAKSAIKIEVTSGRFKLRTNTTLINYTKQSITLQKWQLRDIENLFNTKSIGKLKNMNPETKYKHNDKEETEIKITNEPCHLLLIKSTEQRQLVF